MGVIQVDDEKARYLIEEFTNKNTGRDRIKFVQDGKGNWIIGLQNLTNLKYLFDRNATKGKDAELQDKLKVEVKKVPELKIKDNEYNNISDLINKYGIIIDYIPLPDDAVDTDTIETKKIK